MMGLRSCGFGDQGVVLDGGQLDKCALRILDQNARRLSPLSWNFDGIVKALGVWEIFS